MSTNNICFYKEADENLKTGITLLCAYNNIIEREKKTKKKNCLIRCYETTKYKYFAYFLLNFTFSW